jgi:hypothetical protein
MATKESSNPKALFCYYSLHLGVLACCHDRIFCSSLETVFERRTGVQLAGGHLGCIGPIRVSALGAVAAITYTWIADVSSLLIIAHLTAREMYHSSPESPWTVRVRKPTYRGSLVDNARLEPIQPTFSSASTIYERELPTNARAERIIKKKPLPQSTFIPGQFPSESVPALSPPAMSGAIPQDYGITRLPSLDRTPKVPPHFESAVPVSKCSCCHINHWDPKLASPPMTPRPTRSGKPAKAHGTKKSNILRYLFA